jgi:CotS family spore coat protein
VESSYRVWVPPGAPVWIPDGARGAVPNEAPGDAPEQRRPRQEAAPEASARSAALLPERRAREKRADRTQERKAERLYPAVVHGDWKRESAGNSVRADKKQKETRARADKEERLRAKESKEDRQREKERRKESGRGRGEKLSLAKEWVSLAREALTRWGIKGGDMTLVAVKPERGAAVWKLETARERRAFKLLHRAPNRSLFSVGAQEYLISRGARVPPLVPTRDGVNHTVLGGRMFVMTKWIDGLISAPKDADGAAALCYGLGEFHRRSRGYRPPNGALFATRLHRWPGAYRRLRTRFSWLENMANAYSEKPAAKTLLRALERFKQQADRAIERLEESPYARLIARGEPYWGLVHQDYGWGNGQLGPGGVWIIDLDGVRYDLPVRDLRKMISNAMLELGTWDMTWIQKMLKAYQDAHPIEPDLFGVLLIDLSLPNEFYKVVKGAVYDPNLMTADLNREIDAVLAAEESKWKALQALGLRGR